MVTVAAVARHIWTGLDGLRGVAVLAVVRFHAVVWGVNGYVGGRLFCLSGYLITSGCSSRGTSERAWSRSERSTCVACSPLFPALLALRRHCRWGHEPRQSASAGDEGGGRYGRFRFSPCFQGLLGVFGVMA